MARNLSTRPHGDQVTVLVVEDDSDTRTFLDQLLRLEGYHPVLATTGEDAIKLLGQQPVDFLLLDVMLPDMSGYDLCAHVRRNHDGSMPVVMLSALTQPQDVAQGLERGADDYLKKPFVSEELLVRINHLLQRHRDAAKMAQENAALQEKLRHVAGQVQSLQQASETESVLRREFLHNVATHMQALCGIVDAETRKLPPSPERDTVQRIRSRVYGAALVYQTSEMLAEDSVAIGSLIHTITHALKSMYRPWKRVKVEVTGGDIYLPNKLAAPLTMVVNELITNCFKHAFPDNSFGAIDVRYGLEDGAFWLEVADNGTGFDASRSSSGAGRPAIERLIQGLGGTVTWQSGDTGTRVHVRIPC